MRHYPSDISAPEPSNLPHRTIREAGPALRRISRRPHSICISKAPLLGLPECKAVKCAKVIGPVGRPEDPLRSCGRIIPHRKFKEIRALKASIEADALGEREEAKIRGTKDPKIVILEIQNHDIGAGFLMPKDLRVPILPCKGFCHHSMRLFECHASIQAVCQANRKSPAFALLRRSPCRCVIVHKRVLRQAEKSSFIANAAAGKHGSVLIGCKRHRLLFPVNKVLGPCVSPVHICPGNAVWIVLIIKLIDSVMIQKTIGIIAPVSGGCIMMIWMKTVCHGFSSCCR